MPKQVYTSTGTIQSTTDSSAQSLVERDNNGDTKAKHFVSETAAVSLGGLAVGYVSKSANFTATEANGTIVFDCSAAAATLNLPDASTFNANTGFPIIDIKRHDTTPATNVSRFLTISGTGGQNLDGDTSIYLVLHGESVRIQSDGANWKILNRFIPRKTVAKSAAFNVSAEALVYLATMGSAYTISFPPAANWKGKRISIYKVDAAGFGAVADGDGSENINGATTKSLSSTQWTRTDFETDGTAWYAA